MQVRSRQLGFTLVEFMISMVVFSVVMMAITASILYFTKQYQKSLYTSNTQAVAANIVQSVSHSVKYSNGASVNKAVKDDLRLFCIGNRHFLVSTGLRLSDDGGMLDTDNVLVTSTPSSEGCVLDPAKTKDVIFSDALEVSGSKELVSKGMRLARFDILQNSANEPVSVLVRVVYGEDDLLCDAAIIPETNHGGCAESAEAMTQAELRDAMKYDRSPAAEIRCKTGAGQEYCAVSEINTVILSGL